MVKLFLLAISLLGACNTLSPESFNTQKSFIVLKKERQTQSIDCCLDSVLQQIDTSLVLRAKPIEMSVNGNKLVMAAEKKITLNNEEIITWLEERAIIDSIKSYRLAASKDFYLFSSPIKQATGLAVNFTTWLVVDVNSNLAFEFKSLSENHQAFYFEKAVDELHVVCFTFGESFIHQKDFDNIVYRMENYKIGKGGRGVEWEKEVRCDCK